MLKQRMKAFAQRHSSLLTLWRRTFGKIKTVWFFNKQRKELQKKGIPIIQRINEVLDDANAQYFIDCGTLLGMIRDNKPIQYDRDMDYGIWFSDQFTPDDLDRAMESIGLKKIKSGTFRGQVQEITYASGIIHIDFFRHTETEQYSLLYVFYRDVNHKYPSNHHYSIIEQRRVHIPSLKRVSIAGVEMNIPSNIEEYLASAYTENWRTPDPNWRYTMEPGCTYIENEYGTR